MLLKFEFENVRSFRDRTVVSMQAAPLQDKKDRLIGIEGKKYLPVVAIYGPNAGGKSNLVKAFSYFRTIVKNGKIPIAENEGDHSVYDYLSFFHDHEAYQRPTAFDIEFVTTKDRIAYRVHYVLSIESRLQQKQHIRKVHYEALSIDDKRIFVREAQSLNIIYDNIASTPIEKMSRSVAEDFLTPMLKENLTPSELFLSNGYRNSLDKDMADCVLQWFDHRAIIFSDRYAIHPKVLFGDDEKKHAVAISGWKPFLKAFDTSLQDIRYAYKKGEDKEPVLVSKREMKNNPEKDVLLPASQYESLGTIKFIELIFLFLAALEFGALIVFDEMDASLHPEIIAGIFSVFNDPELNPNGAQLIITTHNPVFLNQKLLRRDQIWFVDRDPETHISDLYRLSDYGSTVVRNDTDIYMHYLMGDYGALPVVDMRAAFAEAKKLMRSTVQGEDINAAEDESPDA